MDREKEKIFNFNTLKKSVLDNVEVMQYLQDEPDIFFKFKLFQVKDILAQYFSLIEGKI